MLRVYYIHVIGIYNYDEGVKDNKENTCGDISEFAVHAHNLTVNEGRKLVVTLWIRR